MFASCERWSERGYKKGKRESTWRQREREMWVTGAGAGDRREWVTWDRETQVQDVGETGGEECKIL